MLASTWKRVCCTSIEARKAYEKMGSLSGESCGMYLFHSDVGKTIIVETCMVRVRVWSKSSQIRLSTLFGRSSNAYRDTAMGERKPYLFVKTQCV